MTPYGLQVEQRTQPLGLDEPHPRLSWRLSSERRCAAQSAYRITAAEKEQDLDDPSRLIWDTGRHESNENLLVVWEGPTLRPTTRYHWRVEIWDETGTRNGRARSWFETGLPHPSEWTAVWIGRDRPWARRLRLVDHRRPAHRDRHGAAGKHRRTADPHHRTGRVRENDVSAAGTPGVLGAEPSAAGLTLRLTSGRYTFTAPA